MESCCTCATILSSEPLYHDEKPLPLDRRVSCCSRIICGKCIHGNRRFAEYCPYCQVSSTPSALPQGLKEPIYNSLPSSRSRTNETARPPPPPYTPLTNTKPAVDPNDEKAALAENDSTPAEDTLHFLNHEHDSIASLALRYGVPTAALRRKNNLASDHLLLGRRTVLIPGEFYKGGVSLSPRPVEGEEEELRKSKIRRFMTSCKVSDYDIALLYLEQSKYELEAAVESFFDDEKWEREHPKDKDAKKKQKNRGPFWRGL